MSESSQAVPKHLYDVPIETLGLSETALKLLRGHGIIAVGDYLDACSRDPFGMITPKQGISELYAGELGQKLGESGYSPANR